MLISLKASRINAGLTSKEAADMVGIHQQTLLKYEKDSSKIPIDLLNKLSAIYQIKSDDIFLGKEYDLIRTIEIKRNKQPT